MRNYFKINIWDAILCTMAAGGVSANIYMGYEMKDKLSGNILAVLVISFLLISVIFAACLNKKTKTAGLAVAAAGLAIAVVYTHKVHPFLNEKTASSGVFWIVIIVVALVTFFLSRFRAGTFVYFAAGNIIAAGALFLEFGISVSGYIIFLAGSAGIIFMRTYIRNLANATTGNVRMTGYAVQILIFCFIALVLTIGIFYMLISPLNLKTHELKLIQTLQSMELVHKIGKTSILPQLDEELTSSQQTEDKENIDTQNNFNDEAENQSNGTESYQNNNESDEEREETPEEADDNAKSNEKQGTKPEVEVDAQAIKYDRLHLGWLWITLGIIAAIILSIVVKKWLRKRWLERIMAMSNREAVINLYHYFVSTFDKLKVPRNKSHTPYESARAGRKYTSAYIYGDCDFETLTDIYTKASFGLEEVSDSHLSQFIKVYNELYSNIKEEKGMFRYILLFYRI